MTPQHHPARPAGPCAGSVGLIRERLTDHSVIAISGELDVASAPFLRERLNVALRDPGARRRSQR
ncbi:hypothetical protein E1281_35285 [Actinomadura sp. KC345]|uniref:STAS domain-containing protein n=1 Tax=Actinomadura sp. KC345 TaxID=2530371 RepID=UPI001043ABCA|nr:STAS domain-containing protein [Actinomadura sp. KC345]TDC43304.1 hypothetical protein E1281_35285 [Actinomadura sp. KC345]